nr:DUF3783 domain-containing protein [uncultured Faecalimonas sp.]
MNFETVLLYNLEEGEKARKVQMTLLKMKVKIRKVAKEQYLEPVGFLAGNKEIGSSGEIYEGEGFAEEMLVMKGFTSGRIDLLLREFRKAGIGRINLKAIVTEHNQNWNSMELYQELKAEHEMMHAKKEQ